MTDWPVFVDNLDGNTLAEALASVLEPEMEASADGLRPEEVRIATAFFSPTGFGYIADRLASVPDVRLMLGVDLAQGSARERRRLGESEAAFEKRRMQQELRRLTAGLARERDHLPFNRTPWEIFIRVLWQLYGAGVEDDARIDENLPLTSFQKHGVARALRLIRDRGRRHRGRRSGSRQDVHRARFFKSMDVAASVRC